MAVLVATNSKIYLDAYDVSGDHNKVSLDYKSEPKDATTFGQTTHIRVGGLKDITCVGSGFWQANSASPKKIDDILYANLAVQNEPLTVIPATGAAGDRAFTFKSTEFDYKPDVQIGELIKFAFTAQATGEILIPATVVQSALAAVTASGNSAGQNIGAASATQKLYATLHVLAVSGTAPTLNAIVQSNVDNTFGAPTARITFAQATAISSQALNLAGPITDTWYRVNLTIGGTTPSFTFAVVIGVA